MTDFSFITYAGLPNLDPDDRLAAGALQARGYSVEPLVWDDARVDWSRAGACVLRSVWDYHLRHEAFVAWAARVESVTSLWNPARLVRWNSDKRYLQELESAGIPIVETLWLKRGRQAFLGELLRERGWDDAVVKPAIGLATFGTRRVTASRDRMPAAQDHLDGLLQSNDVMVQPYIASVEDYGERALVFIAGKFSHAVRKTAFQQLLPAGEAGESLVDASRDEIRLAERVLRAIDGPALYARVDLVRDGAGGPCLIELELVEPSLFFGLHPPAVEAFVDAVILAA
ncbi:MAG: hypothetical protein GIW99_01040 [Candidatus Eremiobacteraeota bacterium]|nr:hypothetical protein [Candidatus Eremiobacteraeota bacterium]MBC5826272.1 hypothetical protein [Candidatus Eremiobacteraeota bacterium]